MKKIFSTLALIVLLVVMVAPAVVFAVTSPTELTGQCKIRHDFTTDTSWATTKGFICPTVLVGTCPFNSAAYTCGTCCLMDSVYTVTDWVFVFVFVVGGIMIVYGGFVLATSAGTPEKVATGRNYILYGAIGIIVALLAKAIPALVASIMSVS